VGKPGSGSGGVDQNLTESSGRVVQDSVPQTRIGRSTLIQQESIPGGGQRLLLRYVEFRGDMYHLFPPRH
jgi:hypothetical protein